jgi:hypothetical protein
LVMYTISVDFLGHSRILTRQKEIQLNIESGTSYEEIIKIIARKFPELVGQVISPDGAGLFGSNMFNRNGEHMVQEDEMGDSPEDGDNLILMSVLAGG